MEQVTRPLSQRLGQALAKVNADVKLRDQVIAEYRQVASGKITEDEMDPAIRSLLSDQSSRESKKKTSPPRNRRGKGSESIEISTCSGFLERGPNGKFSPVGEPEPEKKLLEIDPLQSKIDLPSIRPGGRSGATRRLRTGARRGALALEPYDPDARDADGDGIVQEGTAWERPATARILDALGNEIRRGQQASVRPTGIRVVDRDGNDIDYKPTYEGGRAGTIGGSTIPQVRPSVKPPEALTPEKPAKKAAAKKPAKPKKETPLADHGARSLKERGLPSTREQYRAATTPPEPEAPEVPEAPEPKTPKAKKPKETPVVDDIALSPGVTLASADRPELEKPEKPRSPFKPSPPPLEGRAQELADEADGDFKKFMELLDKEGYVVFDYETTGLQDGNIPVQIGAVRIKDGKIVERFNVFTNPQRPLSDWSKENLKDKDGNPLTDEWLEGQTDLAEAHRQLAEFLGDSIIVAHNLPYDGEIIDRMMKDADIDYKPSGSIDTLMLLRSAVPKGDGDSGPERHTLGSLADFFDVDLGDAAHTADADSEAAALVLQKAMNWSGDNDSSPDIFDAAKQKELFDAATKKYNDDRKEYEVALKQYQADLADYERAVTRADEPVVETPSSPATQEVKLSYVPGDVADVGTIQRQFEAQYSWVEDDMEGFVEYELSPEDLKRVLEELDLPDKEALVKYMTDSAIARIGDYVDDVRQGPLYLSVTPQNLKKILEEKRFKSQFETGTSGGFFNPETRRYIEDKYMGIPKDTPDELRPIYGFQLGEGEGDEVTRSGAAKAYGTIVVKLKDDVRGRTTMTAGDSLDHQLYGIPVDGDVTRERHLAAARRDYSQIWDQAKQGAMAEIVEDVLGGFYDWEEPYEDIITAGASPHYNEIQVHGGLTLDNVEEIIYPSDWGDDLRNEIIALLDQANIEHGEEW